LDVMMFVMVVAVNSSVICSSTDDGGDQWAVENDQRQHYHRGTQPT